jgi:hypothetical protein
VFGSTFVENMSLVDLIFCRGPQAPGIIRASSGVLNRQTGTFK